MRWLACVAWLACATDASPDPRSILESVPERFRPERVRIEIDARQSRIAARPESGTIVVSPAARELHRSVWLHELAHLAAHGPRPTKQPARRLARAIDEAVADYYAGAIAESPLVGPRDLTRPPDLPHEAWAMLGLPGFDPHVFGWKLAALWWRMEPFPGPLLEDLLACLSSGVLATEQSPAGVLRALATRCPVQSRDRIARSLGEWVPSELLEEPS